MSVSNVKFYDTEEMTYIRINPLVSTRTFERDKLMTPLVDHKATHWNEETKFQLETNL